MEIVGVFVILAFAIGTIAMVAICFRWISAHFAAWNGFIKFTLKISCLIIFLIFFLTPIIQTKIEPPQQFANAISSIYVIGMSIFGVYSVGRDYYLYFRRKKG